MKNYNLRVEEKEFKKDNEIIKYYELSFEIKEQKFVLVCKNAEDKKLLNYLLKTSN